jgi:hypothetical protein
MILPRGMIGVMRAILVISVARLDRDVGFRAVRCLLHVAQDASVRFVGKQLQQPGILNVRLGKGQSAISDGARVRHMVTPAAGQAADHDQRSYQRRPEELLERRDHRYRSGSEFRGRHPLRHPAPNAQAC